MAEEQELRSKSMGAEYDVDDQDGGPFQSLGNAAFRRGEYEEAIKFYSDELRLPSANPAIVLSNRCAAYCKQSEQLRKIPSEFSEQRPRNGLDPMSLVQLALKDVEKVLMLWKDWPKAHLRKGIALVQLEQYEGARNAFLEGLQLDQSDKALQTALRDLNAEFGSEIKQLENSQEQKRAKLERSDELDCTLCLKLLYSPVTTPCGHSFCRACLLQAMGRGNKCPLCRTVIFVNPRSYAVSVTLNNLIQHNFPDEYEERKAEMNAIALAEEEILPLFVMDFVLPSQRLPLNIFEPRYRLMVRRVMEGNHRMGMVRLDESGVSGIGCEVEICECQPLPDGRFHIEVEGRRRFGITKTWEQDGYRVAQVKWIEDVPLEEGSREKEQLNDLLKNASSLAKAWLQRGHDLAGSDRRAVLDMIKRVETTPDSTQAESFSFWIAKLIQPSPHEKLQLLRITDTRQRLNREMQLLRDVQGCSVQ